MKLKPLKRHWTSDCYSVPIHLPIASAVILEGADDEGMIVHITLFGESNYNDREELATALEATIKELRAKVS